MLTRAHIINHVECGVLLAQIRVLYLLGATLLLLIFADMTKPSIHDIKVESELSHRSVRSVTILFMYTFLQDVKIIFHIISGHMF